MATPSPPFLHQTPSLFQVYPPFWQKFLYPSMWLNFWKVLPPSPLISGGGGGGGDPTMLVVKCLGNFTFKIQIHFWNSLSNTCLVNMRRFSLPKFSDFLWWNFTSIYRPDVFYLSSSLSLKISKKDCLTN